MACNRQVPHILVADCISGSIPPQDVATCLTFPCTSLPCTPAQGNIEGYLLDTIHMANVVAGVTGNTTQVAQEVIRQLMFE